MRKQIDCAYFALAFKDAMSYELRVRCNKKVVASRC